MLFSPPLLNLPLLCYHTAQSGIGTTCKTILLLKYRFMHYCRRPEEPAILISRLNSRMRGSCVVSIRLEFLKERLKCIDLNLVTRILASIT